MKILPINNKQNTYTSKITYLEYGLKRFESSPISLSPVKNITNNILKKTVVLSNRFNYPVDNSIKNYITQVLIPHFDKNLFTSAWEIKKENTDTKKYLVVLHGLSHNITNLQDLYKGILDNTDYTILAPEYTDVCYPHKHRKVFARKTVKDDSLAIINYLDKKGIDRKDVVIAGHSFGGYIASAMAKECPDIKKLILISPTDTFKHRIYSMETNLHGIVPKWAQFIVKNFKLAKWRLAHIYETNKMLSQVQCPVDIIYSKRDNLVNQETIDNLATKCKNPGNLYILQDGSHRMDSAKIQSLISILNNK